MPLSAHRQRTLLGLAMLALGGMVVFGAYDLGPMAGAERHAPRWIVAAGGIVFVGGGVLLLRPVRILGQVFAAAAVTAMTAVSAWVAVFGDPSAFSGGLPFLPSAANLWLGRGLFALVALLGLAIIVHALLTLLRRRSS